MSPAIFIVIGLVMTSIQKVSHWGGDNKKIVRGKKETLIKEAMDCGLLYKDPLMFSFAGAKAILERTLVSKGLVRDSNIRTVQDCLIQSNGYPSEKILRSLIQTRGKHLPGMYIWPSTFNSFVNGYKGKVVHTPPVNVAAPPKWYKYEDFREEMSWFNGLEAEEFDILDIDMCGPWSPSTGKDIATLMRNNKLNYSGIMFINHLKGRDIRGGRTLEFLKNYFNNRKFIDLNRITGDVTQGIDFENPDNDFTKYCFRNILVPLFYVTEAFFSGYHLYIDKLIEYSDRNVDGVAGTTMMQWMFMFEATDLSLSGLSEGHSDYIDLAMYENKNYIRNINSILNQEYAWEELKKD